MTVAKCFGTETCGGEGPVIKITYLKSRKTLVFPAFLTNLDDRYTSNWSEETVYGRMDPISTYQRTGRAINLSWKVINTSLEEARANMFLITELVNFHYPAFMGAGNSNLISASPLIRILFDPFIRQPDGRGLLGYSKGVNVNPNLEAGFIVDTAQYKHRILPKEFEISLDFTVLHEHSLGHSRAGKPLQDNFPYGEFNINRCAKYEEDLPENDWANGFTPEGTSEVQAATDQALLNNDADNLVEEEPLTGTEAMYANGDQWADRRAADEATMGRLVQSVRDFIEPPSEEELAFRAIGGTAREREIEALDRELRDLQGGPLGNKPKITVTRDEAPVTTTTPWGTNYQTGTRDILRPETQKEKNRRERRESRDAERERRRNARKERQRQAKEKRETQALINKERKAQRQREIAEGQKQRSERRKQRNKNRKPKRSRSKKKAARTNEEAAQQVTTSLGNIFQ